LARAMEIEVGSTVLIINRLTGDLPKGMEESARSWGFQSVVEIPQDREIEELAMTGAPVTALDRTNQVRRAVRQLAFSLK
jgi:CO dehydrogenase nickel-insertion accessory protein CooC1